VAIDPTQRRGVARRRIAQTSRTARAPLSGVGRALAGREAEKSVVSLLFF
jgi:hypothetical protein